MESFKSVNTVRAWTLGLWAKESCSYFARGKGERMQAIKSMGLVPSLPCENERIISILSLTSAVSNVGTTGHT